MPISQMPSILPECLSPSCVLTEGRCPPVPSLPQATPTDDVTSDGTTITYVCDVGHLYNNESSEFYITCENERWSSTGMGCEGELTSLCIERHYSTRLKIITNC